MSTPAIPEHLKKYQEKQSSEAQSLADSGNPTIPRLSIKGSKFRWVYGEEESKKFNAVDVVVVGVDPEGGRMIKSFYKKAFDPANPEPPDCSSINGIVPDSWVPDPQARICAKCPNNAFGSAVNAQGQRTKGKACKDSKWLWVMKIEDLIEEPEETPKVWCLNVPASSLKALSAFGRDVSKTGLPLHVIHVRIELDDEFDYPVLDLQIAGYLDENLCAITDEVHDEQPWRDLVGDTGVPQGALANQRSEGQQMIDHKPVTDEEDDEDDEEEEVAKPQKPKRKNKPKAEKSEESDAAPETTSPDAAVQNW